SDVGHREVDLLTAVVDRIALDHRRSLLPGEIDGSLQEVMRDSPAAVTGSHSYAPHAPDGLVVDLGDLAVAGERGLCSGSYRSPADDLAILVGENPDRLSAISSRTFSPRAGPTRLR